MMIALPVPPVSVPTVAVVVPVFGQAELVPGLLTYLAAQGFSDFEAVLVDNAPIPNPALNVAVAAAPSSLRIRLLHEPRPGSYAARNTGWLATEASWLAFTDADCRPAPGWLHAFMDAASANPNRLLAGPVRVAPDGSKTLWSLYDAVRGIPQERYVRRGYAATANLCVPRSVLESLHGFDATRFSGGDAEFCFRARALGYRIELVPGATILHAARTSWGELAAKARRVKGGQVASGSPARRLYWILRTLLPPVDEIWRYSRAAHPLCWRLAAGTVRLALWGAELAEVIRLLLGGQPERR